MSGTLHFVSASPASPLESDSGFEHRADKVAPTACSEAECAKHYPATHFVRSCAAIALCHSSPLAAHALTSRPDFVSIGGSLLASTRRAILMQGETLTH